jgi:hypothetical protein
MSENIDKSADNVVYNVTDKSVENTDKSGSDKDSDLSNTEINQLIPSHGWTPEHEEILIEWADKSMCYRWLHAKSNAMYSYLNALYTIPVIIISTLTGTANFAQQRVPSQYQAIFMMSVGGFNLLAGIVTTIQQFLKITQLNEAHRVSSIAWDKFYRNIKIEIAKHPIERIEVKHMVKMCKEEFDRLMETSPNIPEKIIYQFKNNFSKHDGFDDISKPEICDTLIPTNSYRNPWFHEENREKEENDLLKLQIAKYNKNKKIKDKNNTIIKDFIESFVQLHNREPLEQEITDNLKDKIDVTIIKKILDKNKNFNIKISSSNEDKV